MYEEETPWKEIREHYHAGFRRGGLCSGGPFFFDRNKRETCMGCDIFWEAPRDKKPISMSDKFVFVVIVMENFHKVPAVDASGQFQMNPRTKEPYTNWERCKGAGACMSCQTALETVFGRIQPWIMSKTHFNQLNAYANRLGCLTCGGRVDGVNQPIISTAMWQCGNPSFRQLIFHMGNTTATMEQINDIVNRPYVCSFCKTAAYPEEVIQCAQCTPAGQIPSRASIFDVDMQVIAQKTGDGDQTSLIVLQTSDPRPLAEQFQPLVQYAPNLDKRFAPATLEQQAQFWQRTAQPQNQAPPVQGYGQQPQAQPQGQGVVAPQPLAQTQVPAQVDYTQPQAGGQIPPGGQTPGGQTQG
jgi:hypothetical protein